MRVSKILWTGFLILIGSICTAMDTAKVVKVWDGDTFSLLKDGQIIVARLVNVDAPEMNQLWGEESKRRLSYMILGRDLEFESQGPDRYKRTLVKAWVNGVRLDSLVIQNGWAWHYTNYSDDTELTGFQAEAICEKRGLWVNGVNGVCPPWLFRQYNQRNRLKYCSGCCQ